jgi:hypothetical protein
MILLKNCRVGIKQQSLTHSNGINLVSSPLAALLTYFSLIVLTGSSSDEKSRRKRSALKHKKKGVEKTKGSKANGDIDDRRKDKHSTERSRKHRKENKDSNPTSHEKARDDRMDYSDPWSRQKPIKENNVVKSKKDKSDRKRRSISPEKMKKDRYRDREVEDVRERNRDRRQERHRQKSYSPEDRRKR